ncbi:MAG: hypothetical protein Q7T36_07190 [Fluviicoccus sp.]|uniref:hypothetical protein n=1 Tax=Fluviicoccus sp. TaxID=2003552 RepID=UPI00272738B6|nr:hypothetical protein [Fluviicoccus sp.]MDO8330238.1 hypothetical protein [Fluviicoccus sp.]
MLTVFKDWRGVQRGLMALLVMVCFGTSSVAMMEMTDENLDNVVGQSLFTSNTATNGAFTYYRLGIDAEMNMNLNINRLALGCDGAGATGTCDIDINRVRLHGISATPDTTPLDGAFNDSGPSTDFMMRRPYLEFAIKNAGTAATREVSGMRIGALEALGGMSIGENPDVNNMADDTGITTISGYMGAVLTNAQMTNVNATPCWLSLGALCGLTATIATHSQALTLRRSTTFDLTGMSASAIGLSLNNTNLLGQPLRTIHRIDVAGNAALTLPTKDFFISVQKENVVWQKVSDGTFASGSNPAAEKGWWMYMPQVQFNNITTNQNIDIPFASVIGGVFGAAVNVAPVDLQQRPADNCWGTLTFC